MLRRFLLLYFVSLISICASAQNDRLFSSERELSSSLVNNVYQDNSGVVWISTEDGLNRYDAAKFVSIKHNPDDSLSLLNNYVRFVKEFSRFKMVVGTLTGIQIFDQDTRKFTNVEAYNQYGTVVINASSAAQIADSILVVGTSGVGMYKSARKDGRLILQKVEVPQIGSYVESVLPTDDGCFWISTLSDGIFKLDSHFNVLYTRKYKENERCFALTKDWDGDIFYGNSLGEVYMITKNYNVHQLISREQNAVSVFSLFFEDNKLYVGTDGAGVFSLNIANFQIDRNPFNINSCDASKLKVHSIIRDKDNSFWLGCFQKGVLLVPHNDNAFHYIGYKSHIYNLLGQCYVSALCVDPNGRIVVGTDNDGIYSVTSKQDDSWHLSLCNGVPMKPVMALCATGPRAYVGMYLGGLYELLIDGKLSQIAIKDSTGNDIEPSIQAIAYDSERYVWLAASSFGIFRLDAVTHETKFVSIHNSWTNCIRCYGDKVYYGTYDGLSVIDANTLHVGFGDKGSVLNESVIYSFDVDSNGIVWAGSNKGLVRFDTKTLDYKVFTINDGLPSNVVASVVAYGNDYLWLGTNHGLSRLDTRTMEFVNYLADDGIGFNEFSKNAVQKVGDNLYFGGIGGVVWFNPNNVRSPDKKLEVIVSDIIVNNISVAQGPNPVDIVFNSDENSFSIEFSALDYVKTDRIHYLYSIDGSPFVNITTGDNSVNFSKLKYGNHTLSYYAVYGKQKSDVKTLKIHIDYPWYLTFWAFLFYTMVLAVIVYLASRIFLIKHKAKKEAEELVRAQEVDRSKLKFFTNIAHEIRTPMTLINGPLQKLISTDTNSQRQKSYGIMSRNTSRILNLVNQLMDMQKIDSNNMKLKFCQTDIIKVLDDVISYFEFQSSSTGIVLSMKSDIPSLMLYADMANVDKIFINIIANAFKFTPNNGAITVSVSTVDNADASSNIAKYARVVISDNGTGIPEDKLANVFDRFFQVDNSNVEVNAGTGVGLNLTYQLVKLHFGSVSVHNNTPEPGCAFVVDLPMGCAHLNPDDIVADTPQKDTSAQHSATAVQSEHEQDAKPKRRKTSYKALIVEDDLQIRDYLKHELSQTFIVSEASNGKEAYSIVLSFEPDIIVSDVMMPIMDGIEFTKKVKANVRFASTPVVLLTALSGKDNTLQGLDSGADAYLEKPFDVDILIKIMLNSLDSRRSVKSDITNSDIKESLPKMEIKTPDDKLIERVMKVINDNISNPDLNVEMVASIVGISRVHLYRKLKELTNQTSSVFIRNIRLQQAATLLAQGKQSISEVAMKVGFSNLAYFSTMFRELYGVSPKEYMTKGTDN